MKRINTLIKNKIVFIKYLFASGFSFIFDLVLYTIFIVLFKNKISFYIILATICARAISSFFNYLLNRNAVFKNNDKRIDHTTLFKYYMLVVIQACVSGLLVSLCCSFINPNYAIIGIPIQTIVKIPIEVILFIINYFVQKIFIFNDNPPKILINNNIKYFLLAIFTPLTFLMELSVDNIIVLNYQNMDAIVYLILGIFIYKFYEKYYHKYSSNIPFRLLSLIFSLLMVLGYSYDKIGNAFFVFGNVYFLLISFIKLICYYQFFNLVINLIYDLLCHYKVKDIKHHKFIDLFNKHPFIVSAVIILICYIPYIIAFYPAIMAYDPANQIKEFMGMHTRYMDSVILLDKNVTITNFNPVLHTLLLGGCFKLGYSLGSVNLGLFLYSIIQLIIMISCLAYSISFMKKEGVVNKLLFIVLAIYALVPVFPFYGMTTNKDTIFCSFILLYVIRLYDLIKNKQSFKKYSYLFIIMLLVVLFRNNGIYTICLSLPFLLIWLKEKRKAIITVLLLIIICYTGYNKVLLPTFKISNTSIREMLSIPFQQTARYVKEYPNDFSEHDKKVIDKVLQFDTLAKRYNPVLSDPVKNKYNIYTTDKELKEYFEVWVKGLVKRPTVYFDATINNVYGYFYPNTTHWYIYSKYNTKLKKAGFNYHYNSLSCLRDFFKGIGKFYPHIPILGLIVNIGFVGWVYLFLFAALIVKKDYKYIPFILPAISFMLVCIAGPANTYFRYAFPYIMSLPVTLCLLYNVFKMRVRKSSK